HAMIFPNLFLGEMNIQLIEPVTENQVILHVAPIMLKGAPEVNKRSLQQTPGAFGPAAFLFADDATIAERNQLGMVAREPEWVDMGRGLNREIEIDGALRGHFTDETSQRGFWKEYRRIMSK